MRIVTKRKIRLTRSFPFVKVVVSYYWVGEIDASRTVDGGMMSGFSGFGERGFLSNYPPDVVMVVGGNNGVIPITKGDILDGKLRRQARKLEFKRRNWEPVVRPCFVWVFCNDSWLFNGHWLYVKTLKKQWQVDWRSRPDMVLKIMGMFPCGVEPVIENFTEWKADFAAEYHYPTRKRPMKQGMVMARAVVEENGRLLDVRPLEE